MKLIKTIASYIKRFFQFVCALIYDFLIVLPLTK